MDAPSSSGDRSTTSPFCYAGRMSGRWLGGRWWRRSRLRLRPRIALQRLRRERISVCPLHWTRRGLEDLALAQGWQTKQLSDRGGGIALVS